MRERSKQQTHPSHGSITILALELKHLLARTRPFLQPDRIAYPKPQVPKEDRHGPIPILVPIQPRFENHDR